MFVLWKKFKLTIIKIENLSWSFQKWISEWVTPHEYASKCEVKWKLHCSQSRSFIWKTHKIITYSSSFSLIGRTHIISFIRGPSPTPFIQASSNVYHIQHDLPLFPNPPFISVKISHFSCPFCMNRMQVTCKWTSKY